jgi:hypothetical protein
MALQLEGNATPQQKELILNWPTHFGLEGKGFAEVVGQRVKFTEASVRNQENGPKRLQSRVIGELIVGEGQYGH